jgi:DNA repair exonuclease SbcCD nuclease subunit
VLRFAHLADAHLGAFRDPVLKELNLQAFLGCLDVARETGVEFLVMAGDLFDSNLPDMAVVERAAAGLRALRDAGVRIYAFHGSHDRSPTETGVSDVLASAGLFENMGVQELRGENDTPAVVHDEPTGAVLAAIGGRPRGLERKVLEAIDKDELARSVEGAPLAIFGYHGAIKGMLPPHLDKKVAAVSQTLLPPGFHYYALGHVHHHAVRPLRRGRVAVYPGPTFGADFRDLSDGNPKGLVLVEVKDDGRCHPRYIPVEVAPIELLDIDVGDSMAEEARVAVGKRAGTIDPEGKVVLLKVRGILSQGRPAEVGVPAVRQDILKKGALVVYVNRAGLHPPDRGSEGAAAHGTATKEPKEVARELMKVQIDEYASPLEWLVGQDGLKLALDLFDVLRQEKGTAKVDDHKDRVINEAMAIIDLEDRSRRADDSRARGVDR